MAELIRKEDDLNTGREKLNNAIKAFNETVVEGDSSVEAAQARVDSEGNTYSTLKERLDDKETEFSSQLAERPTQTEVNALLGNISDGTPLFADNVAGMTDTTRLYVNLEDGFLYAHNGSEFISTGKQYQEKGIAKDGVKPEHLSFLKIGKNKVFKRDLSGIIVTGDASQITTTTASNTFSQVALIEPNKTYTVKKYWGGNRFRVATVSEYPEANNLPQFTLHRYNGVDSNEEQEHTFTNTEGAKYLIVTTNSALEYIPPLQVEEGNEATPYEGFEWDLNIYNKGMDQRKEVEDYFKTGKNLFNGRFVDGFAVHATFRRLYEPATITKCAIVPIKNGKTYTVTKFEGGNRFRILLLDEYPKIENLPISGYHRYVLPDNNSDKISYTFDNVGGVNKINYMVLQTNSDTEETPLVQVEEGSKATSYEPYELYYLDTPLVKSDAGTPSVTGVEEYYFLDDIEGIYNSPDLPSVAIGDPFRLMAASYQDLYDVYDNMVNHSPEYITRTHLGDEATGLPLYQYHFKPLTPESDIPMKRPKIIITSGIHADEKMSMWGMMQFLREMVENWESDPILEFIRWNFELIVLPVCNPSGIALNRRQNSNDIDLNRNFPTETYQPNFEHSGTEAGSELETQMMMSVIQDNLDADYLIDCHTWLNAEHGTNLIWGISYNETKLLLMNLISTLSRKWKKDYTNFPDVPFYGYVSTRSTAGVRQYAHEVGIKAMTLETVDTVYFGGNTVKHDSTNVNTAVEIYGNALVAIAKNL